MRSIFPGLYFTIFSTTFVFSQASNPETNIVYGDHYIFTINTPEGWINDKALAVKTGLTNFFYSKTDVDKKYKTYMYAHGYDKDQDYNLEDFVEADLEKFKSKYKNLAYDSITSGATGPILNTLMLRFYNMDDRYKEEVVYMETREAILILSFTAFTEQEYITYQNAFDEFISSFMYRGNNPKPFIDWMKNRK